ncbi:sarcosine oxidase subunit gamma [Roseovarius atlanticus]|uniref:sarcosine oxidase subunit gamma n=1 Tax=Roseovarius atlanticus TaxID=1641875 RepID=UPI001C97C92D|nr:sarcosine oxidase subunit gamma [Roseovarius atlanticus]MBY5986994.1 sarcosine oxidase subunit gamma [Roseovarius atlanticus]MBY6125634.1 sarcosine oxidase subunit gamma [Roseovarius atlanticus]MBY6149905.1 sarcosine oxidase subunit gamma [Roseovarius atlanticus]
MADFTLTSEPPLKGFDQGFGDTRLHAPADLAIVSIALPLGDEDAALKAIGSAFDADLPAPGLSVMGKDNTRLVRLGPDQAFAIFTRATPDAEPHVQTLLNGAAYTTDQTDVWTGLVLDGPLARTALERICPIDLHPDAFAEGAAARTVMEHLGVLILRTGPDAYLLLSASSSAGSFLHAVETSLLNVT